MNKHDDDDDELSKIDEPELGVDRTFVSDRSSPSS